VSREIGRVERPDDERIAAYRDVGHPEALAARGVFVAEGRLVVQRLVQDGRFAIESVLVTPAAYERLASAFEPVPAPVLICAPAVLHDVTGFDFHRGCLAIARRPSSDASRAELFGADRLLVLEGVGNPDNVGGIFRVALALGAGAVLLDERSGDPLYRKAIRTSMAATLRVPFARMAIAAAIAQLGASGFETVALTPAPDAIDVSDVPRAPKIALLLGSEGGGLSNETLALAGIRARIPIEAIADSLNVAVAAAIALYALRPRR
jgi:tRNA G18 (ribose-2'-O)-methylase SpoU